MPQKEIAGIMVNFDDNGYMTDFSQWNRDIAIALAKENGINDLSDKHWEVITYIQKEVQSGAVLSIRKMGKSGVVDIKTFYDLFPDGPLKKATLIAGVLAVIAFSSETGYSVYAKGLIVVCVVLGLVISGWNLVVLQRTDSVLFRQPLRWARKAVPTAAPLKARMVAASISPGETQPDCVERCGPIRSGVSVPLMQSQ